MCDQLHLDRRCRVSRGGELQRTREKAGASLRTRIPGGESGTIPVSSGGWADLAEVRSMGEKWVRTVRSKQPE